MNICKRAVETGDGPENIGTTSEVDGLVYCCIMNDLFCVSNVGGLIL